MNDAVGEAFFSYLHTINLTDYHDQNFPSTQAKQDAIVKRLDSVARFIKDKYILRHRDLDTNLKNLYDEYKMYCNNSNAKALCKIELNTRLNSLKIVSVKSGNEHNKYFYKLEYLFDVAKFNKWMHSTDIFEITSDEFDDLDKGVPDNKNDDKEEIILLKAQLDEMKNKLNEKKEGTMQDVIAKLLVEQKELNELVLKTRKPKINKIDKSRFELDLNDLEDLCN